MSVKFASPSSLKKGSYVMIDGAPCRTLSVTTSKPGKHGAAKARVEGQGLLDNKKRSMIVPGGDEVEVPVIEKRNAQVLSKTEASVNVMDTETYETFDLIIPDDFEGDVKEGDTVVYWVITGVNVLKQVKNE